MDLRRSVNTKIWDDTWFESLDIHEKLLWIYLITNSKTNMLGVYEISLKKISFESGIEIKSVEKAFESFGRVKKAKYVDGFVVLFNWIKNQAYNTNMKKSAIKEYHNLPNRVKISISTVFEHNLSEAFGTLWNPLQTLPKKEKEKEDESEEEIHNNIFRNLSINQRWIETLCMKWKVKAPSVQSHLNDFRVKCIATGDLKEEEKDAKSHFVNWTEKGNSVPPTVEVKESSFEGF